MTATEIVTNVIPNHAVRIIGLRPTNSTAITSQGEHLLGEQANPTLANPTSANAGCCLYDG
jgi:hypothetical protein